MAKTQGMVGPTTANAADWKQSRRWQAEQAEAVAMAAFAAHRAASANAPKTHRQPARVPVYRDTRTSYQRRRDESAAAATAHAAVVPKPLSPAVVILPTAHERQTHSVKVRATPPLHVIAAPHRGAKLTTAAWIEAARGPQHGSAEGSAAPGAEFEGSARASWNWHPPSSPVKSRVQTPPLRAAATPASTDTAAAIVTPVRRPLVAPSPPAAPSAPPSAPPSASPPASPPAAVDAQLDALDAALAERASALKQETARALRLTEAGGGGDRAAPSSFALTEVPSAATRWRSPPAPAWRRPGSAPLAPAFNSETGGAPLREGEARLEGYWEEFISSSAAAAARHEARVHEAAEAAAGCA